MAYLTARVNSAKLVKSEFDKVFSLARFERYKKLKRNFEIKVMFT